MAGIKNRDPRQLDFLRFYLDPKSETRGNALQSALKAGYSPSYANQIVSLETEWIQEATRKREKLLEKAEANLGDLLGSKNEFVKLGTTQFVAKTLGKKHYSEKSVLEGENGENVLKLIAESIKNLAEKK